MVLNTRFGEGGRPRPFVVVQPRMTEAKLTVKVEPFSLACRGRPVNGSPLLTSTCDSGESQSPSS